MKKQPDTMIYAIALGALVVVGIITTSIISVIKDNQGAVDIRAKAGVTNTLKLTGTVESVNEQAGTISVTNVQLAPESRSGKAVNYGTWTVIPPSSFNILATVPGVNVRMTVNSDSFNIASRLVTAADISILP